MSSFGRGEDETTGFGEDASTVSLLLGVESCCRLGVESARSGVKAVVNSVNQMLMSLALAWGAFESGITSGTRWLEWQSDPVLEGMDGIFRNFHWFSSLYPLVWIFSPWFAITGLECLPSSVSFASSLLEE